MTVQTHPVATQTRTTYGTQMSFLVGAAMALSVVHTTYGYVTGIGDPSFTVTTPVAWAYYLVGFAVAALARRSHRAVQVGVVGYLGLLVLVSVFYYPTTFVPRQQTTFGWFENDVFTGLLMIALYLGLLGVRRITSTPQQ